MAKRKRQNSKKRIKRTIKQRGGADIRVLPDGADKFLACVPAKMQLPTDVLGQAAADRDMQDQVDIQNTADKKLLADANALTTGSVYEFNGALTQEQPMWKENQEKKYDPIVLEDLQRGDTRVVLITAPGDTVVPIDRFHVKVTRPSRGGTYTGWKERIGYIDKITRTDVGKVVTITVLAPPIQGNPANLNVPTSNPSGGSSRRKSRKPRRSRKPKKTIRKKKRSKSRRIRR